MTCKHCQIAFASICKHCVLQFFALARICKQLQAFCISKHFLVQQEFMWFFFFVHVCRCPPFRCRRRHGCCCCWLLLLLLLLLYGLLRQCPLPVAAGCSLLVAMRAFIVAGCFLFVADYRVLVLSQLVSGFVTCFCTCARIWNLVIVSRRCQRRHRHRRCCIGLVIVFRRCSSLHREPDRSCYNIRGMVYIYILYR